MGSCMVYASLSYLVSLISSVPFFLAVGLSLINKQISRGTKQKSPLAQNVCISKLIMLGSVDCPYRPLGSFSRPLGPPLRQRRHLSSWQIAPMNQRRCHTCSICLRSRQAHHQELVPHHTRSVVHRSGLNWKKIVSLVQVYHIQTSLISPNPVLRRYLTRFPSYLCSQIHRHQLKLREK